MMKLAAVVAALVLAACSSSAPSPIPVPAGWTAITDGNSFGTSVGATGSFVFPLAPASVHYVTEPTGSLAGKTEIVLRYRIDADPGVTFHDAQTGDVITTGPIIYFQRAGDDWSGDGVFETYRWWDESEAGSLAPGEHEIIAKFTDRWSAVMTSDSLAEKDAFRAALENTSRVGFTFPNDSGAGHGIYASGHASFTMLEFTVV